MSDNFLPTARYNACGDLKMMYTPPKLDPPCLKIFRKLLHVSQLLQFIVENYAIFFLRKWDDSKM